MSKDDYLNSFNAVLDQIKPILNAIELRDKYINEVNYLDNELHTTSYKVITNDRKTYYEDQENNNLQYYYYLLNYFYIFLLILYLILFFTNYSSFSWIPRIVIFLFLVLYYFIGTFLLGKTVALVNKIIGFFPENVYTDLNDMDNNDLLKNN
jgi:hypothetical protein